MAPPDQPAEGGVTFEFMDRSARACIAQLRGLEPTAIMLETQAADLWPLLPEHGGKVHFGRAVMEGAAESIRQAWANAIKAVEGTPAALLSWPRTVEHWPRGETTGDDAEPDPVVDALAFACRPWLLADLAHLLRHSGEIPDLPRRAEAEYAAALWWLVGQALEHGHGWRDKVEVAVVAMRTKEVQP